jgi:cytochrome c553
LDVRSNAEAIQERPRNSIAMHGIIKNLRPDEMRVVAAYVQSK